MCCLHVDLANVNFRNTLVTVVSSVFLSKKPRHDCYLNISPFFSPPYRLLVTTLTLRHCDKRKDSIIFHVFCQVNFYLVLSGNQWKDPDVLIHFDWGASGACWAPPVLQERSASLWLLAHFPWQQSLQMKVVLIITSRMWISFLHNNQYLGFDLTKHLGLPWKNQCYFTWSCVPHIIEMD